MTQKRLRWSLIVLYVVILVPFSVLIIQTQQQMKWEAYHQHRVLAEDLTQRIDMALQQALTAEEAFGFADYQFFISAADLQVRQTIRGQPEAADQPANPSANVPANLIQQSQLAKYPVSSAIPGLIGYFQIDHQGTFSTPLLPSQQELASLNVSVNDLAKRQQLRDILLNILSENQLVKRSRPDQYRLSEELNTAASSSSTVRPGTASQPVDASGVGQEYFDYSDDLIQEFADGAAPPSGISESAQAGESTAEKSGELNTKREFTALKSLTEQKSTESVAANSQIAFDELRQRSTTKSNTAMQQQKSKIQGSTRIENLNITKDAFAPASKTPQRPVDEASPDPLTSRISRREQIIGFDSDLAEPPADTAMMEPEAAPAQPLAKIRIFESELDPFEVALLDSGEFVLFRNVWRQGKRYIQGAIVAQQAFIDGTIADLFENNSLHRISDLVIAWQGDIVASVIAGLRTDSPGARLRDTLLYQARLSAPFGPLELLWTIDTLPAGPGARLVSWAGFILFVVLSLGFLLIYRLGMVQIRLNHQQQDFVSAVSHELKTPLTSIRMYGEMLKEGWVSAEKQRQYHEFIYDESERLSRLIANILQLARMERSDLQLDIKPLQVKALTDIIQSKIHSQTTKAGFSCHYQIAEEDKELLVNADIDAFSQIIINIVDNALKFAAGSAKKQLDITVSSDPRGRIKFAIRDYGPGIAGNQTQKIFDLFYRPGDELTRETTGTGIGLALVKELARAMGGTSEVTNQNPGAQFTLTLPVAAPDQD